MTEVQTRIVHVQIRMIANIYQMMPNSAKTLEVEWQINNPHSALIGHRSMRY